MRENNSYMVFSGTATRYLAEKICQSLDCPLGQLLITKFSDGEFAVSYEESIRGRDIFLVQSTFPNSDNLMELLLMIDAAKRASARTINAVIPYFGWARQVGNQFGTDAYTGFVFPVLTCPSEIGDNGIDRSGRCTLGSINHQ